MLIYTSIYSKDIYIIMASKLWVKRSNRFGITRKSKPYKNIVRLFYDVFNGVKVDNGKLVLNNSLGIGVRFI